MKSSRAYTLTEILIVLVIASTLLLMNLGIAFSLTEGLVNTVAARSLTDFITNSRYFATVNPEQPGEYTFAAGVLIQVQDGILTARRVKYSVATARFYVPFNTAHIYDSFVKVLGTTKADNINYFSFIRKARIRITANNIGLSCQGYLVLYDKLFGRRYAYCKNGARYTPISAPLQIEIGSVPFNIILDPNGQVYTRYNNN